MKRLSGTPPLASLAGNLGFAALMALLYWWPMTLLGLVVVPLLLLAGWSGTTGPFGNRKHTAETPRWTGFWSAWHYLAIRNPVSNFSHDDLSAVIDPAEPAAIWGFTGASDAGVEGWYYIEVGTAFEFRYVTRTLPGKCLEMRLGWKINGLLEKQGHQRAAFVFRANPVRDFG